MVPKDKELTREEDYRDYEERDIEEGWPYDDAAGERSGKVKNKPYGGTGANFDSETNKGYIVTDVGEDGLEQRQNDPSLPAMAGREQADDLEERVMDALTDIDGVTAEAIDVSVEGSIVTIEGDVDDADTSRHLEARALAVSGVHGVRNNLTVIGIDASNPDDD